MTNINLKPVASATLLAIFIGLAGGSVETDSGAKKVASEAAAFTLSAD
jgi:hypothetical protein